MGGDSAGSRHRSGKDEADEVSDYLQDDNPPRVVGFDADFLGFLRVSNDFFDLLLCEFDFHLDLIFKVNKD